MYKVIVVGKGYQTGSNIITMNHFKKPNEIKQQKDLTPGCQNTQEVLIKREHILIEQI